MQNESEKSGPTSSFIAKATEDFAKKGGKIDRKNVSKKKRKVTVKSTPAVKATGKRRPILKAWKLISVKVGTPIRWKGNPKITAKTVSFETMEVEVLIPGRKPKRFFGVSPAEAYVKAFLKKPVPASPAGWYVWEIQRGKDWETVFDRYNRLIK